MHQRAIILLLITLLCPPLGLVIALIGLWGDYKSWKIYCFCLAWSLAIFAYCYEPSVKSDLTVYFGLIEQYSDMTLAEAFNGTLFGEGHLYAFTTLCWIVGRLGLPGLLPAISVFTVYYIGFYVTYSFNDAINGNPTYARRYILFILVTVSFYGVVNNVRNVLAFMLIGLAVYRECFQKKKNITTLLLYIIPCFLHASAIVIILLRVSLLVAGKVRYLLIILAALIQPLLAFLAAIFSKISSSNLIVSLFKNMIIKANIYFTATDSLWAITSSHSGSIKLEKFSYVGIVLLGSVVFIGVNKVVKSKKINALSIPGTFNETGWKKMLNFVFLLALVTIACVPMVMPEYWRFCVTCILFGGIVYISSGKCRHYKRKINAQLFTISIWVLSLVSMSLWVRNMFLYSDVSAMFGKAFFCNPVSIIILEALGKSL